MRRIELLGEPRVVGFGQTVSRFESKRAIALLAYLALHPKSKHPREVLADRIWPDVPFDVARNRLKQTLASLRRQIELPGMDPGSVIFADRTQIGLVEGSFELDLDEFRNVVKTGLFERAKQIHRGDFMAGFYDDWLEPFRYEYEYLAMDLEEQGESSQPTTEALISKRKVVVPASVNAFIGRDQETQSLLDMLTDRRWITVTGFGGIGKTRLTQHVGRLWQGGDVYFAPFVSVHDPGQIPHIILSAMGVDSPPQQEAMKTLTTVIGESQLLLVLDNLEDLNQEGTDLVFTELLESCANLRILGSSRTPLKSAIESEFHLEPLPVPPSGLTPAELGENSSVRLFVDRTRQSRPDFTITKTNAETVASICQYLDGSPLSIELCAAWARLGTSVLLDKLEQGQEVLVSRHSLRGGRHDSPKLVFESTCQLISESARRLLAHLSIYRGGFEWTQIENILWPRPSFEHLSELIEASLVRADYSQEPTRFTILESLRQHAENLLTKEEFAGQENDFVLYHHGLAIDSNNTWQRLEYGIRTQADWIRFWQRQVGNLRQAVKVALRNGMEGPAVELVILTEWFWVHYLSDRELPELVRGCDNPWARLLDVTHFNSSMSMLEVEGKINSVLAQAGTDAYLTAECYYRLAKIAISRQNMTNVEEYGRKAYDAYKEAFDNAGQGLALHILYNCAIQNRDFDAAQVYRLEAEALFKIYGNENQIHLAALAYSAAREHYIRKDWENCLKALHKCKEASRGLQNLRVMGRTANLFGVVLRNLNEESSARAYLYLSLIANERIRDGRGAIFPLWNLFISLGTDQQFESATVVMGTTCKLWWELINEEFDETDTKLYAEFIAAAKSALGINKFTYLESLGAGMNLEQSSEYVRKVITLDLENSRDEIKDFFDDESMNERIFPAPYDRLTISS